MTRYQLSRLAIRIASDATGVSRAAITGYRKPRKTVEARDYAIRLMRNSGLSLPQIGEAVNRDHATVFHSLKKTQEAANG